MKQTRVAVREPEEKLCIHCGGRLRKCGVRRYTSRSTGVETVTQEYECFVCRKKCRYWVGQVIPGRVIESIAQPKEPQMCRECKIKRRLQDER